jgi:hypothetical protein
MAKSFQILKLDEDTGRCTIEFTDNNKVFKTATRLPTKPDSTPYTLVELEDYLADHWPQVDFDRKDIPNNTFGILKAMEKSPVDMSQAFERKAARENSTETGFDNL